MKQVNLLKILLIILTLALPITALAQEAPPAASDAVLSGFSDLQAVLIGATVLIALIGAFWGMLRALASAGANVSPEAINAIANGLASALERVLADAERATAETPTRYDDLALDALTPQIDKIADWLKSLGYDVTPPETPED